MAITKTCSRSSGDGSRDKIRSSDSKGNKSDLTSTGAALAAAAVVAGEMKLRLDQHRGSTSGRSSDGCGNTSSVNVCYLPYHWKPSRTKGINGQ